MNVHQKQEYSHLTEDIIRALGFGARAHNRQTRKDDLATPYFAHPAGVGIILTKLGAREEVIIAGILHDIIEDTEFGFVDIEKEFSREVAELVEWVSIPSGLSGKAGKQAYIDKLRQSPPEARMISAADMLYNRADFIQALNQGENILEKFNFDDYTINEYSVDRITLIAESLGEDHDLVKDLWQQHEMFKKLITEHGR